VFGPLDALSATIREIYQAVRENRELKEHLHQKNGHISALNSIISTKESTIDSISNDALSLKTDGVKMADQLEYNIDRKEYYKGQIFKANGQILKARTIIDRLKRQVSSLTNQIDSLAKQDGKFWELPPKNDIPKFRPRIGSQAEIIAVANLKGGVGKTTLSANIGATLWAAGKRVLLVDLDYQRTLTNLCLPTLELNQVEGAQRYVDRLFCEDQLPDHAICNLWSRIGGREGYLIAAREELSDIEEHVKAQWLLHQFRQDARFLLRQVLHSPTIQKQFDYVILDCPPRLTLAAINALTACDHLLIPVVLDKASAKAVPRLLGWLKRLKDAGVAPDLNLLGVVANLTFYDDKFSKRERNILSELVTECEGRWDNSVQTFAQGIPRKAAFAEATETKQFAAFAPKLQPVFAQFVKEMNRRLIPHESQPVAKVS